mgnify:CR=1
MRGDVGDDDSHAKAGNNSILEQYGGSYMQGYMIFAYTNSCKAPIIETDNDCSYVI